MYAEPFLARFEGLVINRLRGGLARGLLNASSERDLQPSLQPSRSVCTSPCASPSELLNPLARLPIYNEPVRSTEVSEMEFKRDCQPESKLTALMSWRDAPYS